MDDDVIPVLDVLVDHRRAAHFENVAPPATREQLIGDRDGVGAADCLDRLAGGDQPEQRQLGGAGLPLGRDDLDRATLVPGAADEALALQVREMLVHRGERLKGEPLSDLLETRGIPLVADVLLEIVQDLTLALGERHLQISRK